MVDEREFWNKMRGKVRRALDLDPLCKEESEKQFQKSKPLGPLRETDIDAVMEFVQSFGESGGMLVEPKPDENDEPVAEWIDPVKAEDMDAELMELVNRNRGEQDEETNDILDKHREKELSGDDCDGDQDDADDGQNSP